MEFNDVIDALCQLKEESKQKKCEESYLIFESIELELLKLVQDNVDLMIENSQLKTKVSQLKLELLR